MEERDVFCSKEIEKGVFYRTKHMMTVYDIAPVLPGHSLIIPIRHVTDLTALSTEELTDFFDVLKKIKPVLLKIYGDDSDSYDITAQVGPYSGMSVMHLHIHMVVRKKKDKYQNSESSLYKDIDKASKISPEEYKKNVELLRKELGWKD